MIINENKEHHAVRGFLTTSLVKIEIDVCCTKYICLHTCTHIKSNFDHSRIKLGVVDTVGMMISIIQKEASKGPDESKTRTRACTLATQSQESM